jgi:tRNA(Ile)-lysidine synthase
MQHFFEQYKIEEETVAVGVSGGADSLALALRLKEIGKKPVALTVDHGLRNESADEARYVAEIMQRFGIEHHILCWTGVKPSSGVEEAARKERYRLMIEFCRQNGIGILATGHHLRDQAETFLLRLQRGSGVFGLSGILPVSSRNGVMIIRPQLDKTPEELKAYLQQKKVQWVEDPMNQCDDFLRVKIRKFLPKLAEIGIDEKRLASTAETLAKTRAFIQAEVDAFVQNQVRWWGNVAVSLSWKKWAALPDELGQAVVRQLVQAIGQNDYAPEADDVCRMWQRRYDFKGCTFGKCELFLATNRLWIVPQDAGNKLMTKEDWAAWVVRFPEYKNAGLPYKVRRALRENLRG